MQFRRHVAVAIVMAVLALPLPTLGAQLNTTRIEGIVVGPDRKALDGVVIRLIDEGGYREVGRALTNESGRFSLDVTAGRYFVDADPVTRPDLAKGRTEIEIMDGPGMSTGGRVNVSMVLKPSAATRTGPRFEQQVPAEAQAEFDRALKIIGTDREKGLEALRKSLQIFPTYFEALETLGTEYVKDNHLDHAMVILMKAIEVNPKAEHSHYGLGVTYYRKGKFDLAIAAFNRASSINANSTNTTLYLGLSHARAGHDAEAEQLLKKAYSLGATGVPELHLALTAIYRKSNRNKEAANQLRTLLKEVPNLKDKEKVRELIAKYDAA